MGKGALATGLADFFLKRRNLANNSNSLSVELDAIDRTNQEHYCM